MAQLACYLSGLCERLGGKGRQLVAIHFMACEREHLGTQAHEFDAILVVPPQHLYDITGVC